MIVQPTSVTKDVEHSTVISVSGSGVIVVLGVLVLTEIIVVDSLTAFVDVATVATDFRPEAVMHFETSVLVKGGTAGAFAAEARAMTPERRSGVKIMMMEGSSD